MKTPTRIALYAIPLLLFVGLAILFVVRLKQVNVQLSQGKDPTELPSARLGKPLPDFHLTSLQSPEKILTTADVKGQVVVLNVWATWCPSCQEEHPLLLQMAKAGVPLIGMNYKDSRQAALDYLSKNGDPFRFIIFDNKGDLGLDMGVYGAPESYLIDKNGIIRYRYIGALDAQSWETVLKPRYEAVRDGRPLPPDNSSNTSQGGV